MFVRESKVENHLKQRIESLGGICEKFISKGRRGAPDRLVSIFGCMFLVELKAPKGKLAVWQSRDHELRARCGITVLTLHTVEAVDRFADSLTLL